MVGGTKRLNRNKQTHVRLSVTFMCEITTTMISAAKYPKQNSTAAPKENMTVGKIQNSPHKPKMMSTPNKRLEFPVRHIPYLHVASQKIPLVQDEWPKRRLRNPQCNEGPCF